MSSKTRGDGMLRRIEKNARKAGWNTKGRTSDGHLRWVSPDGAIVIGLGTHTAPQNHHDIHNFVSCLRRAGLTV